jgi:hypothetical protein
LKPISVLLSSARIFISIEKARTSSSQGGQE